MLDPKKIILTQIFEGGGGGGVEVEPLSVTENGTYTAGEGKAYSPVSVSVPSLTAEALSVTENGTYTAPTGKAYSPVTVNVPTGGGGGNIVTGTFKGTTAGSAVNISVSYTGTGYPIAIVIYPSVGPWDNRPDHPNAWKDLVQERAIGVYCAVKSIIETPPTYGNVSNSYDDLMTLMREYKSSGSSADTYTSNSGFFTSNAPNVFSQQAPGYNNGAFVRMKSATDMSVYISSGSGTYGFAANIEYTYQIIYSS